MLRSSSDPERLFNVTAKFINPSDTDDFPLVSCTAVELWIYKHFLKKWRCASRWQIPFTRRAWNRSCCNKLVRIRGDDIFQDRRIRDSLIVVQCTMEIRNRLILRQVFALSGVYNLLEASSYLFVCRFFETRISITRQSLFNYLIFFYLIFFFYIFPTTMYILLL